ncbi:hypothetical protein ES703_91088 [subsurface metagenome]
MIFYRSTIYISNYSLLNICALFRRSEKGNPKDFRPNNGNISVNNIFSEIALIDFQIYNLLALILRIIFIQKFQFSGTCVKIFSN